MQSQIIVEKTSGGTAVVTGSLTATASYLQLEQIGIIIGIICTILSCGTHIYFSYARHKREREEALYKARMRETRIIPSNAVPDAHGKQTDKP